MSLEIPPLTPEIVPCYQRPVVAVRLPDRRIAATHQSLCDAVNLDRTGQLQHIRRNKMLSKQMLLVPIRTEGGYQQMDVLISWAIPIWLGSVHLTRLAPEKQELIMAFQEQIVEALERHFATLDTSAAAQPASSPTHKPPRSALEMHIEAWQETAQELDAREERYETRLAVVEQQLARVMAQVAALEQRDGGARGEEPPPQAGRILSQAHIGQVYVLARHQRDQSGEPISDMLRDLAETFDVPDMSDIPDEGWDHILRWFRGRGQR
ncbi:MAG TPA: phage antirepressor N-terminal domain-containing protein [Ktedonobacterales bacterium]|nr:phage antirepressor N-terminal domain-containing protein [Ktedonobacterales bacterium]